MNSIDKQQIKPHKLVAAERPKAVKQILRLLSKKQPENPRIHLDYADVLTTLGELDEARKLLHQLKKNHPNDTALLIEVASGFVMMGDDTTARDELDELWKNSGRMEARVALLEVMERLGETAEATAIADELAEKQPRARLMQGVMALKQGDVEKSLSALDQLLASSTSRIEPRTIYRAMLTKANALERLERYPEAWKMMLAAKASAMPASTVRQREDTLQRRRLTKARERINACENFEVCAPCDSSPILVTGHPRSGTSVYSLHLAHSYGCGMADEIGAFTRTLHQLKLANKLPQLWNPDKKEIGKALYREQMLTFLPELKNAKRWIDKNPGLEWQLDQWLTIFPSTQVKIIRRNPLDCLISCMFTYLPVNAWTLRFFEPETTAQSIAGSLEIQEIMLEKAAQRIEVIHYEDFVALREHEKAKVNTEININHSPNYSSVTDAVSTSRVGRSDAYREFLSSEVLKQLDSWQ